MSFFLFFFFVHVERGAEECHAEKSTLDFRNSMSFNRFFLFSELCLHALNDLVVISSG